MHTTTEGKRAREIMGGSWRQKLLSPLLLLLLRPAGAQVRRPSTDQYGLDFEGLTTICDFSAGQPLGNEYAARLVSFARPGFGALNGGVPAAGCVH